MSEPALLGWPVAAWKDLSEIVALAVGGWWTYSRFLRGRLRLPRASLRHEVSQLGLDANRILLRVNTVVANPGTVVLDIRDAIFRVQQVLPLHEYVVNDLATGEWPKTDSLDISWPSLGGNREVKWQKRDVEVEPGETQQLICDFVLDHGVRTVQIYSHVKNAAKRRKRGIGWDLTTFYDLSSATNRSDIGVPKNVTGRENDGTQETGAPTP